MTTTNLCKSQESFPAGRAFEFALRERTERRNDDQLEGI